MVDVKRFSLTDLFKVLQDVSNTLEVDLDAYLIGGLAMMHRGFKVATKDVDVVLSYQTDEEAFKEALKVCGFDDAGRLSDEYKALGARAILEGPGGMRFDLFIDVVCKKLRLTDDMRRRAERLDIGGHLNLMATAPEDLFLFKSVTDRVDDLADMALLAGLELDWEMMVEELRCDDNNYRFLPLFVSKLDELEDAHGIIAPIRRQVGDEAEEVMGINILIERIDRDPFTLEDMNRVLDEGEEFSKAVLDRMTSRGIVQGREGRYRFSG